jgi:signal transduction histidine kinase
MRNTEYKKNSNLTAQVKRAIGYRLSFCFILIVLVVLLISVADIISSSQQLQTKLKQQTIQLREFIISQLLIENNAAIEPKINELNNISQMETFHWYKKKYANKKEKMQWSFPLTWSYLYPVNDTNGSNIGTILVTGSLFSDHSLLLDLLTKVGLLFLLFILITIMLYPLGSRIPNKLFISPINNLLKLLRNKDNKTQLIIPNNTAEEIKELFDKISTLLQDEKKHGHESALAKIAAQVAHDIRSPLSVLNIETSQLSSIPERERINIRNAIQRVNDIANNLLSKYQLDENDQKKPCDAHPEVASLLLESIISEKRIQIANLAITLLFSINDDAFNSCIQVHPSDFKRMMSNILNNSIEAISDQGTISISLDKYDSHVYITIIDDGCGIAPDKLGDIFKKGVSIGKNKGSGIGLPYVIDKLTQWQGDYVLTSDQNVGTKFELSIPLSQPANWLATKITITPYSNIIILDDDESIHETWRKRFTEKFCHEYNITLYHFYTPRQLTAFHQTSHSPNNCYLLDYELIDKKINGLKLALLLKICPQSLLVTSRFEDKNIRKTCLKAEMKIIPKPFASLTHIQILQVPEHE